MKADPDIVYKALFRHYRPKKPIIAAVEGVAIAGGTEILQAMEIRVAGESARFGVSEARWSLYPMGGSAVRLPRQIPYTHAAEILLTGKHLSAREALACGLIGHVVPDGQALAKAREIAGVICANGPLSIEAITRTLHECDGMELDQALRHEWEYGQAVFASEDAKEGPLAFAQKREAELPAALVGHLPLREPERFELLRDVLARRRCRHLLVDFADHSVAIDVEGPALRERSRRLPPRRRREPSLPADPEQHVLGPERFGELGVLLGAVETDEEDGGVEGREGIGAVPQRGELLRASRR